MLNCTLMSFSMKHLLIVVIHVPGPRRKLYGLIRHAAIIYPGVYWVNTWDGSVGKSKIYSPLRHLLFFCMNKCLLPRFVNHVQGSGSTHLTLLRSVNNIHLIQWKCLVEMVRCVEHFRTNLDVILLVRASIEESCINCQVINIWLCHHTLQI